MHIQYMVMDAPPGPIFVAETRIGLAWISFGEDGMPGLVKHANRWFKDAQIIPSIIDARVELEEYFEGKRRKFDLALDLRGTEFQLEAWAAMRKIPLGRTLTYGELAKQIGRPNSARALGMACAKNPIPIVIPCHRVLDSQGGLHGFGGGLNWKKWLLDHEKADYKGSSV